MSRDRFRLLAACYLLPIKGKKVLLSRRFNTGWKDGWYSLIAGHLDGNESVSDSMIREAKEESGIEIAKKDLVPLTSVHHKTEDSEYVDFFFAVKKWKGEPQIKEPNKCDDMSWFPIDKLPEKLLPHVKQIIQNLDSNVPFFEHGWNK